MVQELRAKHRPARRKSTVRQETTLADPDYQPPGKPIEPEPSPGFKTAAAFCLEYEPISYAVEPFIRSSSLYTLTAKTGAGKTALFIILLLAVVTGEGEKLLGREVQKGRVAVIVAENPDALRATRWRAMSLDLDLSLDTLIAWKRKPHAMVEDLFGVKPDGMTTDVFSTRIAASVSEEPRQRLH